MTEIDRQELTRRAAPLGFPIHTTLEKPETVVEQIPTPFFSNGAIFRVSTRPPDRPRSYMLGVWGDNGIVPLNNNTTAFFELAGNAGLTLASGSDRVTYVTTFLDATRDFTGSIQILSKIEDAWWLPNPGEEELRHREDLIAKYAEIVKEPKPSNESSSTVIVYLIRDRALIRLEAKVAGDGKIELAEHVLEQAMPTVLLR